MSLGLSEVARWRTLPTAERVASFGQRMRRRRQELGWSLTDLADRMNARQDGIRFTNVTLRAYEVSDRNVSLPVAMFVSDVLGVAFLDLLGPDALDPMGETP